MSSRASHPSEPLAGRSSCISLTQLVVVLDGTIVNIALPAAQAELGALRRPPPVGRHRVRARLRRAAAARRPDRRLLGPQAHLPRRAWSASARHRVYGGPRADRHRAHHRPRAAGCVRRAARAGRPRAAHGHVPSGPRPQHRLRRVRHHRRSRRRGRARARRPAHRVRRLALVPARQRGLRGGRVRRRLFFR